MGWTSTAPAWHHQKDSTFWTTTSTITWYQGTFVKLPMLNSLIKVCGPAIMRASAHHDHFNYPLQPTWKFWLKFTLQLIGINSVKLLSVKGFKLTTHFYNVCEVIWGIGPHRRDVWSKDLQRIKSKERRYLTSQHLLSSIWIICFLQWVLSTILTHRQFFV